MFFILSVLLFVSSLSYGRGSGGCYGCVGGCGSCGVCECDRCVPKTCPDGCPDCHNCVCGSCVLDEAKPQPCENTCCADTEYEKCCTYTIEGEGGCGSGGSTTVGYCCDPNDLCCEGACCDPDACLECGAEPNTCESICDLATQHCCNGTCCSNDNCCIDGECVSTCWTTGTVSGSTDLCPDCELIGDIANCNGTQREESNYDYCTYAGTGTAGYCECHETLQVIGYFYECEINWDCSYIIGCLGGILGCADDCGLGPDTCPLSIIGCIGCIISASGDCVEPCAFVEKCEKDEYNKTPIERNVFSGYGGGRSCKG